MGNTERKQTKNPTQKIATMKNTDTTKQMGLNPDYREE
jgi:hypothetical protein